MDSNDGFQYKNIRKIIRKKDMIEVVNGIRRDFQIKDFKKKIGLTTDLEINKGDSGVYIIYSVSTEWCYIGETGNLKTRFGQHISRLRTGNHGNYKLQEVFNKFSESDLIYIPVYKCPSFMRKNIEYAYTNNFGLKSLNGKNARIKLEWEAINRENVLMDKIPNKYKAILKIHEKWKYSHCYISHSEYLCKMLKNGMEIREKGFKWIEELESFNNIEIINNYTSSYDEFGQISLDYVAISILNDILGREKNEDVFRRGGLNNANDFDSDDLLYNIYKEIRRDNVFRNDIIKATMSYRFNKIEEYKSELDIATQLFSNSLKIKNIFDVLYAYIIFLFINEIIRKN